MNAYTIIRNQWFAKLRAFVEDAIGMVFGVVVFPVCLWFILWGLS